MSRKYVKKLLGDVFGWVIPKQPWDKDLSVPGWFRKRKWGVGKWEGEGKESKWCGIRQVITSGNWRILEDSAEQPLELYPCKSQPQEIKKLGYLFSNHISHWLRATCWDVIGAITTCCLDSPLRKDLLPRFWGAFSGQPLLSTHSVIALASESTLPRSCPSMVVHIPWLAEMGV